MIMAIKNPKTPISPSPIADIFETAINSSFVGFLRRCQTLTDCAINDFIFSITSLAMINRESGRF